MHDKVFLSQRLIRLYVIRPYGSGRSSQLFRIFYVANRSVQLLDEPTNISRKFKRAIFQGIGLFPFLHSDVSPPLELGIWNLVLPP